MARQVVLGEQQVVGGALDDGEESGHARDLLALLLQEPIHELRADEVVLLTCERGEPDDLLGDGALLLEGERDRSDRVRELVFRLGDCRDPDLLARVEEVLDEHHRVVSLLERLAVEVRRELLQGLGIEVDGDRHVLVRGGELVGDLLVQSLR